MHGETVKIYRYVDNLETNNKILLNKSDISSSTVVSAQFESPQNGPCDVYTFRYSLPKYVWKYFKGVKKKIVPRLCCCVPRIPVNICKQAPNEIGITVAHLIGTRVINNPILDRVIRLFSFNLMTIIDYPV